MGGVLESEERGAVLETVEAYFADPQADTEGLLGGDLLEWARLVSVSPWNERYEFDRTLERAEIIELDAECAVVEVRARFVAKSKRGAHGHVYRGDGPVSLRKIEGSWRIVDLVIEGRKRSESIVFGLFAEQRHPGAIARVVGVDRNALTTSFLVELVDTGAGGLRLAHGYALVEAETLWSKLSLGSREPIPDGGTSRVVLTSRQAIDLSEPLLALALDVRSRAGRLPFVMKVPPAPPAAITPQPAPKRLPILRGSSSRHLAIYAAATVAIAWFYGWFAIVVPIYLLLHLYWQLRVKGNLPAWLDRVRYLLDAVVVTLIFLVLWETPAVNLAIPFLIGVAVYVLLLSLGPHRQQVRVIAALTVGFGWLILLGGSTGRLSPCQVADGDPATVADSFAAEVFVGNLRQATRYESGRLPTDVAKSLVNDYVTTRPAADVRTRRAIPSSNAYCRFQRDRVRGVACYSYRSIGGKSPTGELFVVVGCDGRDWRVSSWS